MLGIFSAATGWVAVVFAASEGIPWELIGPVGAAMVIGFYGQWKLGTKPTRDDLEIERKRSMDLQNQINENYEKRLDDAKINIPVLDRLVKYLDKSEVGGR